LRKETSPPLLNVLKIRVDETEHATTPSPSIAPAIPYALNHWKGLIKNLEERKFAIDKSPKERCMRRVTIGRKNNMLAGLEEGAKKSAMICSFFGTCEAHVLNILSGGKHS